MVNAEVKRVKVSVWRAYPGSRIVTAGNTDKNVDQLLFNVLYKKKFNIISYRTKIIVRHAWLGI